MSMFLPRINEFSPLFRLADELDRASRYGLFSGSQQGSTRSFAPQFDVKETKEAYELYGELPGVQQSNLNLEWSDDNTLVISGHTEKIAESNEGPRVTEVDNSSHYHKPTIEEEGKDAAETSGNDKTVTKTDQQKEVTKADENRPRYWISERSYGNFHRTFQFPSPVEHDSVKASLKNGILEVIVPKAKAREPRKITIQ